MKRISCLIASLFLLSCSKPPPTVSVKLDRDAIAEALVKAKAARTLSQVNYIGVNIYPIEASSTGTRQSFKLAAGSTEKSITTVSNASQWKVMVIAQVESPLNSFWEVGSTSLYYGESAPISMIPGGSVTADITLETTARETYATIPLVTAIYDSSQTLVPNANLTMVRSDGFVFKDFTTTNGSGLALMRKWIGSTHSFDMYANDTLIQSQFNFLGGANQNYYLEMPAGSPHELALMSLGKGFTHGAAFYLSEILSDENPFGEGKWSSVTVAGFDNMGPFVVYVDSSTPDGAYSIGSVIYIKLHFDREIVVTNSPSITLETGSTDRIATCSGSAGSSILTCQYTVQANDTSSDLNYTPAGVITLGVSTIKGTNGIAADLDLPLYDGSYSLAAMSDIVIDTTAPDVSAVQSTVAFSTVAQNGLLYEFDLTWSAASDQTALEYKVVEAISDPASSGTEASAKALIATVALASGIATPVMDWTASTTTAHASSLSPAKFHAFAVLVRDAAGNISIYDRVARLSGRIMFQTIATTNGGFGGAPAADAFCVNPTNQPSNVTLDSTIKAFIVDGTRIACAAANCGGGPSGTWILNPSTNYYKTSGLLAGTTDANAIFPTAMANAVGSGLYWSGLVSDWTMDQNCTDWTDSSGGGYGTKGDATDVSTAAGFIHTANGIPCNTAYPLVCVETWP